MAIVICNDCPYNRYQKYSHVRLNDRKKEYIEKLKKTKEGGLVLEINKKWEKLDDEVVD